MKTLNLLLVTALLVTGCKAQDKDKNAPEIVQDKSTIQNIPKESWSIKKEVDEDGNVTRYDSTYTWSYSNLGDSIDVNVDSVLNSFDLYFNRRMPSLWGPKFMNPMWRDSTTFPDFFTDDYFHNRWRKNLYDMDNMFKQMDSMRNRFFDDNYPGLMPVPDDIDNKEKIN